MDYTFTAGEILKEIGGKENLISAAHCATRLRLVIADNSKCDSKAVENVDGVKGVFFASGQLQIIFGTGTVNKIYDEFIKAAGISESSKEDVKQQAASKANPLQRFIKTIGDIFVPIIPAIVASGFLMGIMEALNFMVNNGFLNIDTNGSVYQFAGLISNVAYTFLPILIAFSAAKVFGGNPYLGAVIGMLMIHPDLQNAWTVATEGVLETQSVFFGLYEIDMIGYQGHVIPVIIAVWVMCFIEKRLHKVVPPMFDLFVTPLVSVFITSYLTLAAIGPVFVYVENGVLDGIQWLLTLPVGIGSFIMGGLYSSTVVTGIHHMYTLIDVGQLARYGLTYWLPLASAANVAQGAAALAVALKTKDKKLKSMAFPASLSAFMGITEPAIFGVNIRFIRPFIAGSIGGACGALYASIVGLGATGTGITGIFAILIHLNMPVHYVIAMLIAAVVAFVLSWVMGIKDETNPQSYHTKAKQDYEVNTESSSKLEAGEISSPISGKILDITMVSDQTFSTLVLGDGIAIEPDEGKVYAPFNGKVSMLFDEKHALGLSSEDGIELLIHVGMDTVSLKGEPFIPRVNAGDKFKTGDLLMEFDMDKIRDAGLKTTTPIVITNTEEYGEIIKPQAQNVQAGLLLMKIKKKRC